MGIDEIPATGWMWAVIVALALLNAYNAIATARKNAREEKRLHDSPTDALSDRVTDHDRKLDTDKRRLDEHERRLDDIQRGVMAVCSGVQALLDHELHDGNSDEMEKASARLRDWLMTRP